MIANLKPYSAMKDSGIEWLGEMPAHWEVRRLRYLIEGKLAYGANAAAEYTDPNWPRYLRITDFSKNGRLRADTFRSLPPELAKDYLVKPGDVLLARSGATVGKAFLVDGEDRTACHAGYLIRARLNHSLLHPAFFFAFAQSASFARWKNEALIIATIQNIGADRYADLPVPVPPAREQTSIVRFLDHADRRLRRYIRAKERLIALLEEQKQAIIHQAVTGQIDVRTGQPYPAYKPSGVEWLGDVPMHWSLVPNRAILRRRKILVGEHHTEYELLSLTKAGIIVRDISTGRGKFSSDMGTCQEVRCGDLVFCLFDVPETPRTVGLSRHNGMITGAYTVFECDNNVLGNYLEAFYIAMDNRKLLSPIYSGLRNTIPPSKFIGVKTPIPPKEEQVVILDYLAGIETQCKRVIVHAEREIELLSEYRTRLIADVVTGKLDVREAAEKLPEVDPLADESDTGDIPDTEAELDIDELNPALEEAKA